MLVEHMLTKIGHSSEWKTSFKEALHCLSSQFPMSIQIRNPNGSIGENLFVSAFYFTVVAHAAI